MNKLQGTCRAAVIAILLGACAFAVGSVPVPIVTPMPGPEAARDANPFAGSYLWGVPYSSPAWPPPIVKATIKIGGNGKIQGKIEMADPLAKPLTWHPAGSLNGSVTATGALSVSGAVGHGPDRQPFQITGTAALDPAGNIVITTATGIITWIRL